ncbi:MAG: zinc ABC transporter substrate-binding protein, partial [Alistipes sp.]|nr:zinc ABC transporter substrate-binding protein [Alistipes sp.]
MKKTLLAALLAVVLLCGCRDNRPASGRASLFVSILPLRSIVGAIVGEDFEVEVLVPPGMNPESFEPSPRQMAALDRAHLVFGIGWIDFEQNLLSRLDDRSKIVELHRGITPIAGSCAHLHDGKMHRHGIDPHVWTSPRELRVMAENAYRSIRARYPDSVRYEENYRRLDERLRTLDESVARRLQEEGPSYFMIYHPALTYYARAYGIEQVAIEQNGKEPSARRLAQLIDRARADGMRSIFYQSQFPATSVEVIAEDIGAESVCIDPLAEDVFG